jgi:hypothetical protein
MPPREGPPHLPCSIEKLCLIGGGIPRSVAALPAGYRIGGRSRRGRLAGLSSGEDATDVGLREELGG